MTNYLRQTNCLRLVFQQKKNVLSIVILSQGSILYPQMQNDVRQRGKAHYKYRIKQKLFWVFFSSTFLVWSNFYFLALFSTNNKFHLEPRIFLRNPFREIIYTKMVTTTSQHILTSLVVCCYHSRYCSNDVNASWSWIQWHCRIHFKRAISIPQ